MISRYNLMPASAQHDTLGNAYPDVMLFTLASLPKTVEPKPYMLKAEDIDRFDRLVAVEYGVAAYDDLVLYYNGIGNVHDLVPGQIILFPDKDDLEAFIAKSRIA